MEKKMTEAQPLIGNLSPAAAKLLAVEILLADPESLGNDALEGDVSILRDKLTAAAD